MNFLKNLLVDVVILLAALLFSFIFSVLLGGCASRLSIQDCKQYCDSVDRYVSSYDSDSNGNVTCLCEKEHKKCKQ